MSSLTSHSLAEVHVFRLAGLVGFSFVSVVSC